MFRLRKPDELDLARLRERCRDLPLSYREVGCSRALGSGAAAFERARTEVRAWRMLRLGWVEPCWPDTEVKHGMLVGTLARVFGLWAVNVCRIVLVIEEEGPVMRYGLAYGTLPGHAEIGEERFLVEWHRDDDSVWYDIRAVSKAGGLLTRLAYPLTRRLQRRFGNDSLRIFGDAVRQP
jgi:uncharacterized protein (UPF0548 family)